jgi:hypothetical protein
MPDNFPISVTTKNLFLTLAESITQTLNVISCYVCGGTNMGDHWPWEAKELNPRVPFNESAFPWHRTGVCLLKTSIIGNYCISLHGKQFSILVGDLTCLGQKFYNDTIQETQWWSTPNYMEPQPYPLANFSNLKTAWDNLTADIDWQAPRGLYWICGRQAYMVLPRSWFGSCVLGSIRPSLFLLPLGQGENLGVPIYEQRLNRKKMGNLTSRHLEGWWVAS